MIGEVIAGRYRITARIGSGGTSEVYEAQDLELPRKAAIKLLTPVWGDDQKLHQRFLREAEALSLIDHPSVCTIYKAGETESGQLYIAMAFYEGEHLRARLAQREMTIVEAVATAVDVADGMVTAHKKGVLHRDLKPENIVFTEEGALKIIDFGLAKLADRTRMTETGVTMGTLAYASPEQIRGDKLDERSDVYSLGVMLYQMLTGRAPYTGNNVAETIQLVLNAKPTPPSKLRDGISSRMEFLILSCMAKEAKDRPGSMAEVRDDLIEILSDIAPSATALRRAHQADTTLIGAGKSRARRIQIPLLILLTLALVGTQIPRIKQMVTQRMAPGIPGLVVLRLDPGGRSEDLSLITDGAWLEVHDQALRLSKLEPGWWVLSQRYSLNMVPEQVRERTGAGHYLRGTVSDDGDTMTVRLALESVDDVPTLATGVWRIPGDEFRIARWLGEAMGFSIPEDRLAEVDAGPPSDGPAARAYLRGRGMRQGGRDAVDMLTRASELQPDVASTVLRLSTALLDRRDEVSRARAESLLSATSFPTALESEWHTELARIATARDNPGLTEEHLAAAVEANPADVTASQNLGWHYYSHGAPDQALEVYEAGMRRNPGCFVAVELLGWLNYALGNYEDAIRYCERVTELAPRQYNAWNTLGGCYYALEDWDAATRMFETSMDVQQNTQAISNLGVLYYMDRRFEEAADMYRLAWVQSDSSHTVLGNYAAALHQVPGQEAEAEELFLLAARLARKKLRDSPDEDPSRTLSMLAGYLTHSDPALAVATAEESLRLAPRDPEIRYRVGGVYEEVGNREEALTHIKAAIELGYPLREINNEPLLDDLRNDHRFRFLLP